jgi:hypothetical protein
MSYYEEMHDQVALQVEEFSGRVEELQDKVEETEHQLMLFKKDEWEKLCGEVKDLMQLAILLMMILMPWRRELKCWKKW